MGKSAVGLMKELILTQKRMDEMSRLHAADIRGFHDSVAKERSSAERAIEGMRSSARQQVQAATDSMASWQKRCLEAESRTQELRGKLLKLTQNDSDESIDDRTLQKHASGQTSGSATASRQVASSSVQPVNPLSQAEASHQSIVEVENLRRELNQLRNQLDFGTKASQKQLERSVLALNRKGMQAAEAESRCAELTQNARALQQNASAVEMSLRA